MKRKFHFNKILLDINKKFYNISINWEWKKELCA